MSFRYSCMCNGSLPCCATWFGIVITDYVYAPRYKVVSNRPPLFPFRMSPVFQRCGPNPAGALVSRVIVFEYKIHLVLTPLWYCGEWDSLRSSFLRWVIRTRARWWWKDYCEGYLERAEKWYLKNGLYHIVTVRVHFSRNVVKSSIFVLWVAKKCFWVWILNIRLNWSFLDTGSTRSCNSNTANPFLALSRPENVVLALAAFYCHPLHWGRTEVPGEKQRVLEQKL